MMLNRRMERRITYKNANTLYQEGKYSDALSLYLQILKMSNPNEKLLLAIANCFDHVGNKPEAIKYYKKIFDKNGMCVPAVCNMAIAYYETGEYSLAKKCARKALDIDSKNSAANLVLGNIFYQAKEYNKAIGFYEDAIEKTDNLYIPYINIANSYIELKEY